MGEPRNRTVRGVIPWHRRLEARVLLGVTLIAGLSLAAVAFVTGRVVRSHTFDRAREDVTTARAAFTTLINDRAEFLLKQTGFIVAVPVFRAHMQTPKLASDPATMTVMASDYCDDLDAAFCIVTSVDGQWLASPGIEHSPAASRILGALVRSALENHPVYRIIALDGALYLAVAQPARYSEEVLGSFLTAYRLDDELAQRLSSITRNQVALIADGAISGSSLTGAQRESLADVLRSDRGDDRNDVKAWQLAGRQYVGGRVPLVGEDALAAQVLLLEDWEPTERFIDDTVRQLSEAGALVFLAAVILSIVLSRRMSRPLRDIAERAADIAAGEWNARLTVRGSAEAVVMAEAFNDMTRSLSHWHAQAQERTEQLQAAYERYAAVTNSAPDSIVSADADGVIVFWNRSAARAFGCGEEDAIGRTLASLFEDEPSPGWPGIAALVGNVPAARTFEANARRHDGTTFPCEVTVAMCKAGGAGWLTAIIRDITERRRAEDTLRLRDAQLRQAQKMEAIGRLASGVAHDFNNALAVIQGYTEDMIQCLGDTHEHQQDLREVLKASQSAASLTRQLLAFSRKQAIDPQVISLADVVRNVERMLARLVGTHNDLRVSLPDGDDEVYADRGQLEQVIINLCVNARDAISGSGRVDIGITRTRLIDAHTCDRLGVAAGDYVTLAVADTGCGMDAATAAHIFEPFFTTKEAGKGTGLGLATAYGVVRQSGGGIDVVTSPGAGTTFRVYLPVARENLVRAESAREEETRSGSGTVLLVEDEAPLRTILRRSLQAAGYAVLEAESAEAALSVARSHAADIDVLLTDVVMPGMNGVVLSKTITVIRPGIRVLLMSGHAADSFARDDFDPTCVRFLQKPFSGDALCRELRDVLAA